MKLNLKLFVLLLFSEIIYCGFSSFKENIKIENKKYDTSLIPIQQDSLNLLNEYEIDNGFNQDITLSGDTTYNLYKSKVRFSPGYAREVLTLKTTNSLIFIVFSTNHLIEKIRYCKLEPRRIKGRFVEAKKSYQSGYFGFKIGDSLPFVLGKLKSAKYKIEKDLYSKENLSVVIHGHMKIDGIYGKSYDEYNCEYCFINNKLVLIEINYSRDPSMFM